MHKAMTIYIVAVLAANYTATWFIPLPIFGMVSVGTLIFGVTFTQRDRVHRPDRRRRAAEQAPPHGKGFRQTSQFQRRAHSAALRAIN